MRRKLPPPRGSSGVFLMVRLGLWSGRRKTPEMSHHIRAACCLCDKSLLALTLTTWLRSCLSGFSDCKVPPFRSSRVPSFALLVLIL